MIKYDMPVYAKIKRTSIIIRVKNEIIDAIDRNIVNLK